MIDWTIYILGLLSSPSSLLLSFYNSNYYRLSRNISKPNQTKPNLNQTVPNPNRLNLTQLNQTISNLIWLNHTIPCNTKPNLIWLNHTIPYHTIPNLIWLNHTIPYHTKLYLIHHVEGDPINMGFKWRLCSALCHYLKSKTIFKLSLSIPMFIGTPCTKPNQTKPNYSWQTTCSTKVQVWII